MINRARNGTYKSMTVYIANDNQELRQVSDVFVKDMNLSVELECNLWTPYTQGLLVIDNNMVKHTIGKDIDALTAKNIIRIIIIDAYNYKIDKTFVCIEPLKISDQSDKSGDIYTVEILDIHAYYLAEPLDATVAQSYTGTPMKILQDLVMDSLKLPDEILRSYGIPVPELRIESSGMSFLGEPEQTTLKVTQDKPAFWYIAKLCKRNYVYFYQDFEGFVLTENPDFSKMSPSSASDGSPLWSEFAPGNYDFLIYDKVKQNTANSKLDCPEITVSLNSQGKSQETQTLNVRDVLGVFELNGNADETANLFDTRRVTESSGTTGLKGIMSEYSRKYMTSNNLVIYVSGPLFKCQPGSVTSVELRPKSGFVPDMYRGDYRYSGNWLIRSCTAKTIGPQMFFIRLVLCRFDNPKPDQSSVSETGSEERSDMIFDTTKPKVPKITRFKAFHALDDVLESTKELTDKVRTFQNQIAGYQNYASQKIDALTAPIKTQFVNQVKDSEVYKTVSEFSQKNRRTLGLVNDIVKSRTGINLLSGVSVMNEIMNIDSVIKDATIGQVERVIGTVTAGIQNTVSAATGAVNATIQNVAAVRDSLDKVCTNIDDAELNFDSGIELAENVLKTINDAKRRVDTVKTSVESLKKTVQSIPDTVKTENPLAVLKKKREQILMRVRPGKSS